MKKSPIVILFVVLCLVIVGMVLFSSKKPESQPAPVEAMQEEAPVQEVERTLHVPGSREAVEKELMETMPDDLSPEQLEQTLAMYEPEPQIVPEDPVIQARMTKMGELARVSSDYVQSYRLGARAKVIQSFKELGVELDDEAAETITTVFVHESIDQATRWVPIWEAGLKEEGTAREVIREQLGFDWETAMFWYVLSKHPVVPGALGDEAAQMVMDKMHAQSQWVIDAMERIDQLREEVDAENMR